MRREELLYRTQQAIEKNIDQFFVFEIDENLIACISLYFYPDKPQLAEVDPGKTFLVYEAASITPSAAAPLADIKDQVALDWRKAEGTAAAKAAAQRVIQRLGAGQDLTAALAAEKIALPPIQPVAMGRDELAKQPRIPPALALMFSMAKGTVKRLEAPQDREGRVAHLW